MVFVGVKNSTYKSDMKSKQSFVSIESLSSVLCNNTRCILLNCYASTHIYIYIFQWNQHFSTFSTLRSSDLVAVCIVLPQLLSCDVLNSISITVSFLSLFRTFSRIQNSANSLPTFSKFCLFRLYFEQTSPGYGIDSIFSLPNINISHTQFQFLRLLLLPATVSISLSCSLNIPINFTFMS